MSFETLDFRVEEGVAHIQLARAKANNALNLLMCKELMQVTLQCGEDSSVRAVRIASSGKIFCSGGDLGEFAAQGDAAPRHLKEMTTYLHAAMSRLLRMDAPVIAAVQGMAAGAGFSLAVACDLVLAASSAKFTMAYTRVGLSPDGSSTYILPRLIGLRRSTELMLTNRMLSAEEAQQWGLVNQIFPDDQLEAESIALARSLAAGPTRSFGAVKRLLLNSANDSLESQMEQETIEIAAAAGRNDGKEGIAAFFAKRPAQFQGK